MQIKYPGRDNSTVKRQKKKTPMERQAIDLNRHFFKEDMQMTDKHMKRCSISLVIWEMQTKTIRRYHITPTG